MAVQLSLKTIAEEELQNHCATVPTIQHGEQANAAIAGRKQKRQTRLLQTSLNFTVLCSRESDPVPPHHSAAPPRLNTSIVAVDLFLIREAAVGGGAGQVHLSQAASLPVLLPPPRERSTAVTRELDCTVQKKEKRRRSGQGGRAARLPSSVPSELSASPLPPVTG